MTVESAPVTATHLAEYARLSIAFRVESVLSARPVPGAASLALEECAVAVPYIKDYDAISERPADWPQHFDTSHWRLVLARIAGQCVGAAAVAMATPGVQFLEGRTDLALLWDIRVDPVHRGHGVGRRLFATAGSVALSANCVELKVETQNTNVAACRFYSAMGCSLRTIREHAYPTCPGEAQYLWHKALRA